MREGRRVGIRRRGGVAGRGREGGGGGGGDRGREGGNGGEGGRGGEGRREGGRGGDRGIEVRAELLEVFEDTISQKVLDKIGDEEEREIDSEKEE